MWRYRHLYIKLFLIYARQDSQAFNNKNEADLAFYYITGIDWNSLFEQGDE